jgi:hypothetical protein
MFKNENEKNKGKSWHKINRFGRKHEGGALERGRGSQKSEKRQREGRRHTQHTDT